MSLCVCCVFDFVSEFRSWVLAWVGGPWGHNRPGATTWAVPKKFLFLFFRPITRGTRVGSGYYAVWCLAGTLLSWRARAVCWRRETARGMSGVRWGCQTSYSGGGRFVWQWHSFAAAPSVCRGRSPCSAGGLLTPHAAGPVVCARPPVFAYSLSVVIPLASAEEQWLVTCV